MATIKKSKRIVTICALLGILVIAASLLVPVTQVAAKTAKFRVVFVFTKMEPIQVGDVEGHFVGTYEIKGLSSHENGEVATYRDWGTFDSIEGFKGYFVLTFEDGSTQWANYQGTSKPAQDGKVMLYEGTWECIKGTGRFEEIEGSGSFTGKNFTPPGVVYIDYTGTYTLPTASIRVEDLIGLWQQPHYALYLQLNEDGTFRVGSTIEGLEKYPYDEGRFQLEGTLFTYISTDESRYCPGQTGSYHLKLIQEGQLQFILYEDPCEDRRSASAKEPFSRVSP